MSKKPETEKTATARGATENTTGVYRLPVTIKEAIETEAAAGSTKATTPAGFVRLCVAKELKRLGYKLAPETELACHL